MYTSASSNAVLQVRNNSLEMDKLLRQIQTGNRINSAADDASGMTIADNLRMQSSSLAQGTKNAIDAKSLLNIADSAMTSFKETIGKMKEKAMSAASDVSSPESRQALQKDLVAFIKSLDNIAQTTSFNGIKLLDGSFNNKSFQVGAYANQTVSIGLNSLATSKIGHLTESVSNAGATAGTTAATLKVNGATIQQVAISGTGKDGANLLAQAINAQEINTGVTAIAKTSVNGAAIVGGSMAAGDMSINGVSIGALNFNANDNSGSLVDAINSIAAQTGVFARVSAGSLVLESSNGENIHITEANGGAAKAGLVAGTNFGKITMSSTSSISVTNGDAVSGLNALTTTNYTASNVDVRTSDGAQRAMKILDSALVEANRNSSDVGAVTNQLDRTININQVTETNVKAAEQNIRGADMEALMDMMSKLQIKSQAALFSLNKANEANGNILALLR